MPLASSLLSVSAAQLQALSTGIRIPFCPHIPTPKQTAFLLLDDLGYLEAFFGGAGGGGKSDVLLMGALRYAEVPGYAALIFRKSFTDLALPGAIMNRAKEWLVGQPGVEWSEQSKTFTFPSKATLSFAYLDSDVDKYRYRSTELQYIGFDELTEFKETTYRYLFSRLRRLKHSGIPIRMRCASNPGGTGHDWVKQRFIVGKDSDRAFIPAKMRDNPFLDVTAYRRSLSMMHPVDRARIEDGDWAVVEAGGFFQREWFPSVVASPIGVERMRYWDKAATPGAGDFTAGVKVAKTAGGIWFIEHVVRGQWAGPARESVIKQTAAADGHGCIIGIEQEPGSGGKDSASDTVRGLAGYTVYADPVTGDKASRAKPLAAQAFAGNVRLVEGPWNLAFLDELTGFPGGANDDQVDAASGGFNWLSRSYSAGAF